MTTGMVFDIREFAVHDGPGIRTTVFLKGCPLACTWCHNPEGQSLHPQVMISSLFSGSHGSHGNPTPRPSALSQEHQPAAENDSRPSPDDQVPVVPPAMERIVGVPYTSEELAALLNRQAAILKSNEGGVTFSGGEPLLQAGFIAEVIDRLDNLHIVLDTSGCGTETDLRLLLLRVDLVYYDLKIIDSRQHQRFTGQRNDLILSNLRLLSASGVPFVIRVPLVPGATDTDENLSAIARLASGLTGIIRIDLLPYNRAAGAKYRGLGMEFSPGYDESKSVNLNTAVFEQAGLEVCVA